MIVTLIGFFGLIYITWIFHLKKHKLLKNRLINSDETLLTDSGLKIESVFQAPQGSVVYPYIIVNEETTRLPENDFQR